MIPDPPRATYRLQFNRDFTFRDATALVDYFAALGISHLYASPFLKARPGSTHGYDITDHNEINPEIGTREELDALVAALHERGMGLVLDFVPNHMGIGSDNAWWLDVLEWGEQSPYAAYFDIDWDAARPDQKGKVLLPILGDQYGAILTKGEIKLRFDAGAGSISACYYDHRFPICPTDYAELLQSAEAPEAASEAFTLIVDEFAHLGAEATRRWRPGIRDEADALKRGLAALAAQAGVAQAIDAALAGLAGQPGQRASWRPLHAVLERQSYRLAYWRVAADEINYRRFFNINDLAGIRIELPELFDATHRLAFELIGSGALQGLRIDHIDGLFNPGEYAERLQAKARETRGTDDPLYVVVEKILEPGETLPDWPVAGTSGYDFVNEVGGIFVDPDGEAPLTRLYHRVLGRPAPFEDVVYDSKKRIMQVNLASEMAVLAREFHRLSMSNWASRDFTLNGMRDALEELIAAFPVYRTYVGRSGPSDEDRRYIEHAIREAKRRSTAADTSIYDFLQQVIAANARGYNRLNVLRLAMRFQQVTGPVMAKGLEDTAFYRYFRLLSLNEVGGDPGRFGIPVAEFHRANRERRRRWPHAMLTTATHDTKRGEDSRARLNVLTEIPREWGPHVVLWSRWNAELRTALNGEAAPVPNHEYLFYQTLLGAWELDLAPDDGQGLLRLAERIEAFIVKATREGKEQSSWSNPNEEYEKALSRFVRGALDPARSAKFLADFHGAVERTARAGAVNSLAQTLLKLTAPGVPDTYQGGELWDFSMVDPDNRRPVDWDARRRRLEEIGAGATPAELSRRWRDGGEKLFLIWKTLTLRAERPALFAAGGYEPVEAEGAAAGRLCAFVRRHGGERLLVAVPRLTLALHDARGDIDWQDTKLVLPEATSWHDVFSGRAMAASRGIAARDLFRDFPVALCIAR